MCHLVVVNPKEFITVQTFKTPNQTTLFSQVDFVNLFTSNFRLRVHITLLYL